ncbi:hypothetical protein S83_035801, partial [Arachis hypogaea]
DPNIVLISVTPDRNSATLSQIFTDDSRNWFVRFPVIVAAIGSGKAKLTKLPKNLMAKILEQLPRVISSLDAYMDNGLQ